MLGSLLSLGVARVSGYVKPSMLEPALRTAALSDNERTVALKNALAMAESWGAAGAERVALDLTTAREETVTIHFYDENRKEDQVFEFTLDGEVRGGATADDVKHFFRCRRSGLEHVMDKRVLRIVADISKHFDDRTIEIISAFRRRGFGAKHSKHYEGRAIDLRVRGVPIGKVRDYVWTKYQDVGVGHYTEQNFLHVDYRTVRERVAWSQRTENSTNTYNPAWSRHAAPQGVDAAINPEGDDHDDYDFLTEGGEVAIDMGPVPPLPEEEKPAREEKKAEEVKEIAARVEKEISKKKSDEPKVAKKDKSKSDEKKSDVKKSDVPKAAKVDKSKSEEKKSDKRIADKSSAKPKKRAGDGDKKIPASSVADSKRAPW